MEVSKSCFMTLRNILLTTLETYNLEVFLSRWTRLLSLLITFEVFHYNRYKNQSSWYGYFARESVWKLCQKVILVGYSRFIKILDYILIVSTLFPIDIIAIKGITDFRFLTTHMHNSLIILVVIENYTD